jgi:hypothetical protein
MLDNTGDVTVRVAVLVEPFSDAVIVAAFEL